MSERSLPANITSEKLNNVDMKEKLQEGLKWLESEEAKSFIYPSNRMGPHERQGEVRFIVLGNNELDGEKIFLKTHNGDVQSGEEGVWVDTRSVTVGWFSGDKIHGVRLKEYEKFLDGSYVPKYTGDIGVTTFQIEHDPKEREGTDLEKLKSIDFLDRILKGGAPLGGEIPMKEIDRILTTAGYNASPDKEATGAFLTDLERRYADPARD